MKYLKFKNKHLVKILPLLAAVYFTQISAQTLETECITTATCEDKDEGKPLWEAGVGGISVHGPDYPGADESNTNLLLVPYFIYRGEVFQAGEGGLIKAKAFEDNRYTLDLSLDGAFSADSDDNDARKGMDDLDYLFGIGPELTYHIDNNKLEQRKLDLSFQLRTVFSTDFSELNQRGYAFETKLSYEQSQFLHRNVKIVTSIGPMWGTEKLTDYFYEVSARDALPDRREYEASGGYLGTELSIAAVINVLDKKGRIFFGTQANFLQGAENKNSPLLRDETTFAFAVGFAYRLLESDQKAGSAL